MAPTHKPCGQEPEESRGQACLERTRAGVLNVLIADGLVIAVSGALLRYRTESLGLLASRALQQELMVTLIVIAVTSYVTRRILAQRLTRLPVAVRESRFIWAHLWPALIAALAAPLGLVYGWWVDPSVQSVVPFWIVALALGTLSLPRVIELECFDSRRSERGSPPP